MRHAQDQPPEIGIANHTNVTAGVNNANFVHVQSQGLNWSTGTSTTTCIQNMYGQKQIISVVIKEITIEIAYRESPNYMFTNTWWSGNGYYSQPPDRVWKEIYGLKDGRMTLLEVVQGKHRQAYRVEEEFIFDDDVDVKSPNG